MGLARCTLLLEVVSDMVVAFVDGPVVRGPILMVFMLYVGAGLGQFLDHLVVALDGGPGEGRHPRVVPQVELGSGRDKPPDHLEAAIAAHAASSVSLDAEEADVKAASTEMDDALASLQKWRAVREADRKALEMKLQAEYSPPKLALDLDRTALAARTEEALSSARGARGRVEALLKAPRAEAPSGNLPVFRRDGDAFREAADAELRELEANLARLQALHGDLEAWSDDDDDEEAKG